MGILKLVGVTLVIIVCLGLPKYFHLLQTSTMGYLSTVLMSGNRELAFHSGRGIRETSITCYEGLLQDLLRALTSCFSGFFSTLHRQGRSRAKIVSAAIVL